MELYHILYSHSSNGSTEIIRTTVRLNKESIVSKINYNGKLLVVCNIAPQIFNIFKLVYNIDLFCKIFP